MDTRVLSVAFVQSNVALSWADAAIFGVKHFLHKIYVYEFMLAELLLAHSLEFVIYVAAFNE
mgnify:CR=1 FL=1